MLRLAGLAPCAAWARGVLSISTMPLPENTDLFGSSKPHLSTEEEEQAVAAAIVKAEARHKKKPISVRVIKDYKIAKAERERERAKRAAHVPSAHPFNYASVSGGSNQADAAGSRKTFQATPPPYNNDDMVPFDRCVREPMFLYVPTQ